MLIRQTAPVIGAAGSPYAVPGQWQISVAMRGLKSDTHYRLDERQVEREELGTYVINRQYAADLTIGYAISSRLSVMAGVPFVAASWSIPTPTSPTPGPRAQQDARGIGDISGSMRYWLFDTANHPDGNLAIGGGLKLPTGNYQAQDMLPDSRGSNDMLRYVDQSIQPGDGGWGIEAEVQGFRRYGRFQLFGSASYLANPRDTNGTPSVSVSRLPPGATPSAASTGRLVNSVPDQYLTRVGTAMPVGKLAVVTLAYRIEGQRRYDLIGASHGFRRPGLEMFVEPGISLSRGRQTMAFSVPIGIYRNRKPDPYTGLEGDATFPGAIALGSYSLRLGGRTVTPPAVTK
ncbi:MAG TPA: hypothetical protein VFX12_11370 [Vicinamibacterales bacterium]|nr:hypothetical protein [Vicinamibacterales bacterium]